MMQVKNRACVRTVAVRSLRAFKMRNLIAVIAIMLTTMLFTALFTIAISINDSFQQSNFLMAGGDAHGSFKKLTEEQMETLKKDPLIRETGARLFLGMGTGDAFRKTQVEVSYMDAHEVKHYFCTPTHGHRPKEGSNEAMTDTRVLKLLGVQPKIGTKFTVTYQIGGGQSEPKTVTQEFVLSGWWDYNGVSQASNVIVPESYVKKTLQNVEIGEDEESGKWSLDVMFGNALHIEKNMRQVIRDCGFQSEDASKPGYIAFGVNWGYPGAQSSSNLNAESIAAIVALLVLIVFTGYLVIYNVFQISVTNDIRFYGLLKTIGMTGRQLKRIIRLQAVLLSAIGIPAGLLLGFGIGVGLAPAVMAQMSYTTAVIKLHAWVFVGAALFSLVTVFLSCNKPGRIAAKVSPVEAVRYTEADCGRKKAKAAKKPASLGRMAWANVGRNRKKTVLVVISLSLAVVLLNLTVMFANGFDMDLYLKHFCVSDFVFANADYFNVQKGFHSSDEAVEDSAMQTVLAQNGVKESGCVYGQTTRVLEKIKKKDMLAYFTSMGHTMTKEQEKGYFNWKEQADDGSYYDDIQLYGMDAFPLQKVKVLKGDVTALDQENAIAAVYKQDDYDKKVDHSNWAGVGDQVTLRYVNSWKYFNAETGKEIPEEEIDSYEGACDVEADDYTQKTYTVVAEILVPSAMNCRYYGSPQFVLGSDTFIKDTGTKDVMHMMFDMKNNQSARAMESFLKNYTEQVEPLYSYESKFSYEKEFDSFRGMFLLLGGVLSGVIAVVGTLNFLNAILTGMIARRREFAVLQSVGMTRRQLKRMLVYEGLLYTFAAIAISLILVVASEPFMGKMIEKMFWFFRFQYTIGPVVLAALIFTVIGAGVPLVVYCVVGKQTIVERLRETE